MCRNIRPLFNFDPPATKSEINNASLQFVRKLTGFQKPSQVNEKAFLHAVEEVSRITEELFHQLETTAVPRNREQEIEKAKLRNAKRFPSNN